MQLFFSILYEITVMEAASSDVFSAASLSSRSHDVSMWSMCPSGSTENASDGHDARLHAGMMRYQTSHGNYELPQSALGVILSTLQQLQTRIDSRFDSLERRVMNIERGVNSIQKQQQAAMNMKKRKRCCSPLLMDEKPFIETTNSFNGSILDSLPCLSSNGGYIVTNVVDEHGSCHSYKFPASVVEKMLKDNPPEPSGWAASKALVSLLDYVYHPLELAMRRLPALPASNSLSSNLQGRQKSELFVGTQYETGIEFPPDRLLPCCKLIEHYYPGWKFKAFERNHAFREIVHKKCRTRRRDLKQYLLTCGKTKEQALDSIIKGIDLPPREYLGK
ncbi:dITP/XTP pyrophosphatase [Trichinella spiralis]|uniref:DITP/XTP pyrophosphatase n=1 Tax=Trichinella spiralis TaxID=6334 RepID=A0ABR3KIR7_TRISP